MAQERRLEMWMMMKSRKLEIDNYNKGDVICVLCKQLMINAHSGPCGCRYCLDCITEHLRGKAKSCPGNWEDCKEESIDITKNIYIDQPMNKKISSIIVKCPESRCEFKGEIRIMVDHLKSCEARKVNCPYFEVGCKESNIVSADLKDHLVSESVSHSVMLGEFVVNFKKELNILKEDVVKLNKENKYLINVIELLKRNEIINADMVEELNRGLEEVHEDTQSSEDASQNFGEFVWCIDQWKEKSENTNKSCLFLYSDAFFSHKNGYKMCLQIYPQGIDSGNGTHLSLYCCLMKGEFDETLPWPFKHEVNFELINLEGTPAYTFSITPTDCSPDISACFRPEAERNSIGIGTATFVALEQLSMLLETDQLTIKCSVTIKND